MRPIAYEYREGKVKSTPIRGVKEYLKPCAYKRSEPLKRCRRAFCIMNLRVAMSCEVKGDDTPSRSESEAEEAV